MNELSDCHSYSTSWQRRRHPDGLSPLGQHSVSSVGRWSCPQSRSSRRHAPVRGPPPSQRPPSRQETDDSPVKEQNGGRLYGRILERRRRKRGGGGGKGGRRRGGRK